MTETAERIEDRLSDFTRDKRILLLSAMAVVVGLASACTVSIRWRFCESVKLWIAIHRRCPR